MFNCKIIVIVYSVPVLQFAGLFCSKSLEHCWGSGPYLQRAFSRHHRPGFTPRALLIGPDIVPRWHRPDLVSGYHGVTLQVGPMLKHSHVKTHELNTWKCHNKHSMMKLYIIAPYAKCEITFVRLPQHLEQQGYFTSFSFYFSLVVSTEGVRWMGLTDDRLLYLSTKRTLTVWSLNTSTTFWSLARCCLTRLLLVPGYGKSTRLVAVGEDSR